MSSGLMFLFNFLEVNDYANYVGNFEAPYFKSELIKQEIQVDFTLFYKLPQAIDPEGAQIFLKSYERNTDKLPDFI